ncbi:MAG: DUF488 family protein [Desulfomonilia bacterium]
METIWTVGHSTRTLDEFITLLSIHDIHVLADVRAYPGSRRYPHFNRQVLSPALERAGISYLWFQNLGGWRRPRPDSRNTALKSAGFRGYADYMETQDFKEAITSLLNTAREKRTALMCAEALWWRCHRSLISDYMKSTGVQVLHILDERTIQEHPYTSAGRISDGRLTYEPIDR